MALANIAPEVTAEIYEMSATDPDTARQLNADVVALNRAISSEFGIPGLKYAMRQRGAPAGHARSPHQPPDTAARERLDSLVAAVPVV